MPSYRIVVIEHARSPQAGKYLERLGSYDPKSKQRVLSEERIKYWMSVGAKPSDTVHNMLVSAGILSAKKINVLPAFKAPTKPADAEGSGVAKEESAVEIPVEAALAIEAAASVEDSGEPKAGEAPAEAAPEPSPEKVTE